MLLDGVHHVAVLTKDSERLHAFYRDMFDATIGTDLSDGPGIRLSCQIRVQSDLTVNVVNRASATGIPAGPDGALWFTNRSKNSIGRISTSGTITTYTDPGISSPHGITAGPDGALWFTNYGGSSIGRITTTGQVTNYIDPSITSPQGITKGPDGALWFTNLTNGVNNGSIGRIATDGQVTNYTDPSITLPYGIAAGPDGALWFTQFMDIGSGHVNSIGRITTQ